MKPCLEFILSTIPLLETVMTARLDRIKFVSIFSITAALIAIVLAAQPASATNLYFTGSGTTSNWDNSTPNWSAASGGPYNVTWGIYDFAYFEGTGGTVNVNGPTANAITINANGYVFNNGTIGFGNPGNQGITLNGAYTATFNSALYSPYGNDFQSNAGSGTVILAGTGSSFAGFTMNSGTTSIVGGSITDSGDFLTGNGGANATFIQTGGQISVTGGGFFSMANQGGTTTMNLSGGTLQSTSLVLYLGTRGNVNMSVGNGELVNVPNIQYFYSSDVTGTGKISTVTLSGGTLATGSLASNDTGCTSTINFNGGLLQATGPSNSFLTGLTNAYVQSGGAFINDGGYAITVGQNLLSSSSPDGGLTKSGAGTLTLTGANTYNGGTTISQGTLSAATIAAGSSNLGNATTAIVLGDNSSNTGMLNYTGVSATFAPGISVHPGGGQLNIASANQTLTLGSVTGSGPLTIGGGGTVVLSGNNASTGAITVSAGALYLNGANATTGISVASGATLGGSGSAASAGANLADSSTLDLSRNTGSTFALGALTFSGGATVILNDQGGQYATRPAINAGTLTTAASPINLYVNNVPSGSGTMQILHYAGSILGSGSGAFQLAYPVNNARSSYSLVNAGNVIDLNYSIDYPFWAGKGNGSWDFSSTGNWYANSTSASTTFLAGDNVVLDDRAIAYSGTTAQVVTINAGVNPNSVTFSNTAASYRLQGTNGITGSGSLALNGAGLVTIANSNGYTGGTTLSSGTLSFGNGALGSGNITFAGNATLQWNGSNTQDISAQVAIATGATARLDTQGNSVTLASGFGGAASGGIVKTGVGTLALAASNGYAGGTTLANGILALNNNNALGTGAFNINGGTIDSTAGGVTLANNPQNWNADFAFLGTTDLNLGAGAVTMSSSRIVTVANGSLTVGGPIAGTALTLTKAGNGTLVLAGANTFNGGALVNAGTLVLSGAGIANNCNIAISNSANLTFSVANGSGNFSRGITGAAGNVAFNVAGDTSDNGGGDGTQFVMSNTSSFTGTVVINTGIVSGTDSAFGDTANVIQLNAPNGNSAGLVNVSTTSSRAIQLVNAGGNGIFRAYNGATYQINGVISGPGNFVKTDGGTYQLLGANTFTGTTRVGGGTLKLSNSLALQDSTLISGGIVFDSAVASHAFTFGGLGGSGNIALNDGTNAVALSVGNNNSTTTYSGALSGNGSLTMIGAGMLTLGGASSYAGGTTISGGTVQYGVDNALPTTGPLQVSGGVLDVAGHTATASTLTLASGSVVDSLGFGSLTATVYNVQGGLIGARLGDNAGSSLNKTTAALVTLGGANTYTGPTTISAGTLALGPAGTLGSGNLSINSGGVLDVSAYGGGYSYSGTAVAAGRSGAPATDIKGTLNLSNIAAISVAGGSNSGTITISNGGLGLSGGTWNYAAYDRIAMSGPLTVNGVEYLSPVAQLGSGTYTLFTAASVPANPSSYLAMTGAFGTSPRQTYTFGVNGGLTAVTLTVTGQAGNLRWIGGSNQTWDTQISQNWFNANTSSTDYFFAGDNVTFNDTPGTATNVTINGTVQPGALTVSNTNVNYTFGGTGSIGNGTSLVKNGPGSLTINTYNTYVGGTFLNAGTINANAANALGSGSISVSGGVLNDGAAGSFGSGALTVNGGTANVNNSQSLASATINSGALNANAASVLGSSPIYVNGGVLNDGAANSLGIGTLTVTGGIANLNNAQSVSAIALSGGLLNVNNNAALGFAPLTISGGTLDNSSGSNVTVNTAPTQNWNGSFTFRGSNPLDLGSGAVTLNTSPTITVSGTGGLTVDGAISGPGYGLTKAGPGQLTLTGSATYTGGTSVNGGTLSFQDQTVPSTSVVVNSSATLQYNISGTPRQPGTTLTGAGTVQKSGAGTLTFGGAGNVYWNLGAGGLIDVEAGTLVGGSSIQDDWTNNLASLKVASGAVFDGVEANVRVDALNGAGTIASGYASWAGYVNFTFGVNGGSGTFSGVLADSQAAANFVKSGGGVQVLTGANTYTGNTTINGGTLQIGNGGAIGSLATGGAIADNATLAFSRSDTIVQGSQFSSSALYGTGSLVQVGPGTLVLNASNTYSGLTSVNGGALLLAGGALNTASPVSVAAGATFGGSGSAGTATVAPGATIQGGYNGAGNLSLSALNFSGSGSVNFGGLANSYTASPAIVVGSGGLSTNGASSITINIAGSLFGTPTGTYQLIGYSSIGGSGTAAFHLGTLPNRGVGTLSFPAGLVDLNLTLVDFLHWTGAVSNQWDTSTANWVLNSSHGTTTYIDSPFGDTVVFDDGAGTKSVVNIASPVHPSKVTFSNSASSYILQGTGGIAGNTGLTINGPGSLTINNSNGYSGGTNLLGGRLNLGNSAALGSGPLTIAGGTLDNTSGAAMTLAANNAQNWNGSFTFGGSNPLNLGTGAVTLSGSPTVTVSGIGGLTVGGVIGGAGQRLTKAGPGLLTLTAVDTYSGGTTVNGGTLSLQNQAVPSGGIVVNSNAMLQYNNSGSVTQSGVALSGAGTIQKTGTGTLTFGGGNAVDWNLGAGGLIDVEAGTLVGGNSIQDYWTGNLAGLKVASGATFNGVEANVVVDALSGSGTISSGYPGAGYSNFTFGANGGSGTFSGVLTDAIGPGSFVKSGNGTQVLSGTNTYTGGTTVNGGTLIATNVDAIADGTSLTVGNASAFPAPVVPAPVVSSADVTPVPEPGTLALVAAAALAGIGIWRRKGRMA
jgi:autotransporter-associated beta strand protein